MEFFLCDSADLENPDGVVNQVTNIIQPQFMAEAEL